MLTHAQIWHAANQFAYHPLLRRHNYHHVPHHDNIRDCERAIDRLDDGGFVGSTIPRSDLLLAGQSEPMGLLCAHIFSLLSASFVY